MYHGTGFHSAAMGWGWDPPKSWEAVTAEEVVTLTSQLKGVGTWRNCCVCSGLAFQAMLCNVSRFKQVGREADAVALLQKVLAGGNGTTGGARALVVESERWVTRPLQILRCESLLVGDVILPLAFGRLTAPASATQEQTGT